MGVNEAIKRTFLQFSPGRGAAAVWPWNKFYLALSQEHKLPLSFQLAHCKLCRRGVLNKQMTRANITCSALFFTGIICILSTASSLKLYVWKSYIIIMNFCHSSHLQRLQNQIIEIFLTLLLDLQTIQAQRSHRHREGKPEKVTEVQMNKKTKREEKTSLVSIWQWYDLIKSVFEEQISKTASTQTSVTMWEPRWSLNGSCGVLN